MSCFPCFAIKRSNIRKEKPLPVAQANAETPTPPPPPIVKPVTNEPRPYSVDESRSKKAEVPNNTCQCTNIATQTFTFRELATATKNFRKECLLGEGGFGRVYKGTLQTTQKVVAIKQLDRNGLQGNKDFLVEVLMLSLLRHPNLANLVGYCADGDQRLLVYEYMPMGSLEDSLLDISEDKKPLDWVTRMKIASGVAQGLEYLHVKANPPVIYRDLKSSNILLDEKFNPRLTDFGLAKLGHSGNKISHAASRVMGTYGYCAPEYERMGELTLKSDMYSFGVVLLELITGRRAIDTTRPNEEQNLVSWAQPIFRDPKRFAEMADPLLRKDFPEKSLNQAVGIAAMCLQEEASVRPLINDVVAALSFLTIIPQEQDKPTPSSTSLPHSQPDTLSNHHNQRVLNHPSEDVSSSGHDNDEDGSEEYNSNGVNKGSTLTLDKEEDGDSSESLYGIEDEDFGDDYISKSIKGSSKSIRRGSNSIGKSNGNLSSRRRKNISNSSSSSSNILGETSEDESDDGKS